MKPLKISAALLIALMLNLGNLAAQPKFYAQSRATIPRVSGLLLKDTTFSNHQMLDLVAQATDTPSSTLASKDVYNQARENLPSELYMLYRVVDRIVRANELDAPFWKIRVVSSDSPDAFTRGAYAIILDESIMDLVEGDLSAIAYIVAHEMAHQTLGHQAKFIEIQKEIDVMLEESLSEVDSFDDVLTQMMKIDKEVDEQFKESFHSMELEADRTAYFYIARAGFEPEGSLKCYEAFEKLYGNQENLTERLEALRLVAEQHPAEQVAARGRIRLDNTEPLPYELSDDEKALKIKLQATDYSSEIDELLD